MGGGDMHFDLVAPKHGGDLPAWQRQTVDAEGWLDLSSACNREPWPIPELPTSLWYELPDTAALMQAASDYFAVAPTAVAAGTQQFIELLPPLFISQNIGKQVLVPKVGYQEHGHCWRKWGFDVQAYDDIDELLALEWDIAVVIQPNNPTGVVMTAEQEQALRQRIQEKPHYLILDEAFLDAMPLKSWLHLEPLERCFILRSVGKFFGLAGARVGFLFADARYKALVNGLIGPWPIATPALHLVAQALADKAWQEEALESLEERGEYFVTHIVPKLNTLFDSQERQSTPLFFTWNTTQEQALKAFHALHSVGVHIRLGEGWVRLSLPAGHEMMRLNKALVRLLQGHQLKELG